MEFLSTLRCPLTKNGLEQVTKEQIKELDISDSFGDSEKLNSGLLDSSHQYFYPIFDEIIVLHQQYALYVGKENDIRKDMSFDKKRVFDYYNDINYKIRDSLKIYEDSPKWVDFRDVSKTYIRNSFTRASKFYPDSGRYFLDIASGPIGLPEYMELSGNYEVRVCIDISINALVHAKINIERAGKKGIYICGDITNIPLKDNVCDVVLSQHTVYHIPKKDQKTAVEELYRVGARTSKIVIVYSWFYHSWFMNLSLNFIQIYRILRHFAGKLYVKIFPSRPRLYFFAHSPAWFKKSFSFSQQIEFHCWRSTNKYFLKLYIHKWLGGKKILDWLTKMEDQHSKYMSTFGEYPVIVIDKKEQ
jgi:ubiquinone/menaquinone biosynthesis C-methylase UbiE/uncharacterized protein YbaR (Trm112 family)